MRYQNILLAGHGTAGAQAAEQAALKLCAPGAKLHQLTVVPDFWKGMLGDDWLNNAVTQIRYGRYVEGQLEKEVRDNVARVEEAAVQLGLEYSFECIVGDPAACLLETAAAGDYDLVVMGSQRPKHVEGFNSRLRPDVLTGKLKIPLLIIPYPESGV